MFSTHSLIDIIYRREATVADDLEDEIDVDSIDDKKEEQKQVTKKRKNAQKVLQCENEFCKDYGKVFKYNSAKLRHDT